MESSEFYKLCEKLTRALPKYRWTISRIHDKPTMLMIKKFDLENTFPRATFYRSVDNAESEIEQIIKNTRELDKDN